MTNGKKITKRISIFLAVLALIFAGTVGIYAFRDFFAYGNPAIEILGCGGISIHFIDVGQADAVLIMTNDGNILIDCGTTEAEVGLESYLKELGIVELEYLILTHPHDDHVGGADMILNKFSVKNVVMEDNYDDVECCTEILFLIEQKDINVINAYSGYQFRLGDCTSTILAPNSECEDYSETNSTSVVVKVEFGKYSVVCTGDAEVDSEYEMIEKYGNFLDCDILKLGHHGSKTSSSYKFLSYTTPSYAIACCGMDNTYGHPASEVAYRIEMFGIELIRTDTEGSVVFVCDGTSIERIK